MAGSDRKRQKKLEKTRKKRELHKKEARKLEAKFQGASLLRLAGSAPFGPCWVSVSLDEVETEAPPPLVSVLVTRRVRGQLLGMHVLVDRTCLGVKDANQLPLQPELALRDFVAEALQPMGTLRECQAIEAQSVILHALDYAASLGFGYHTDFEPTLIQPRPEVLLETPLAHPARPFYVSGPKDAVEEIIERLDLVVGEGNYDFMGGLEGLGSFDFDLGGEHFEGEDFEGEDDAIETTAETVAERE